MTKKPAMKSKTKSRLATRKKVIIVSSILIALILFVAYQLTGFNYTIARLRCGHKPIYHSTSFLEGREYVTPDNPLYELYAHGPFNEYYCTEEQAVSAGYYKDLRGEEYMAQKEKSDRAALLEKSPVTFPVYTPTVLPSGIEKTEIKTETVSMTLQDLRKAGAWYGYIRQTTQGSKNDKFYWLCSDPRYPCTEIGKTNSGHTVYRNFYLGANSTEWGVRLDSTNIQILIFGQQDEKGLNDETVISAFNSLEKVK